MILHLVTDRKRLSAATDDASAGRCLIEQVRHAVAARIDVVQIREPDLTGAALARLVRECADAARGSVTRIVVNDRLDVALGCGAAGVHLRADSIPAEAARAIVPEGFVVGCSVHSVAEAERAAKFADYLIAGAIWPTPSKPAGHALLGLGGLARIAAAVSAPVLGIGGVSTDNAGQIAATGARGIAAIGLFIGTGADAASCRATTLADLARRLRAAFDSTGSPS